MKITGQGCTCKEAVLRTFDELRQRDVSEAAAFESARTVFRFHHPEIPALEATKTVDEWIGG